MPSAVSMRHGVVAPVGEVVRRGAHVEHPDVAGELERIEEQLPRNEGPELHRPLVQVHPGVKAPRLLELGLPFAGGRLTVARRRLGREEAERVEMRAAQLVGLDHLVGPVLPEPQRHGMPVLRLPVDHRPLVQAEAAEARRPVGRGAQDPADVRDEGAALGAEARAVDGDRPPRRAGAIPAPACPGVGRGIRQLHTLSWMPPVQHRRLVRVVGEEEILDRVRLAAARPLTMGARQRAGTLLVGRFARTPDVAGEHRGGRGRDRHRSRIRGACRAAASAGQGSTGSMSSGELLRTLPTAFETSWSSRVSARAGAASIAASSTSRTLSVVGSSHASA